MGDHILFQVAFNTAVLAAFERLTGKTITVPPHNEVMGAIGSCLIARRKVLETPGFATGFRGLWGARKDTGRNPSSNLCANQCDISKILVEGHRPVLRRTVRTLRGAAFLKARLRDLFAERERLLMSAYQPKDKAGSRGVIGYPRMLTFHEYYPFFQAFSRNWLFCSCFRCPPTRRSSGGAFPWPAPPASLPRWRTDMRRAKEAVLEGKAGAMLIPFLRETFPTAEAHPYANHCSYIQFIPDLVNEAFKLRRPASG